MKGQRDKDALGLIKITRTTLLHLTHWSARRLCMIFSDRHSLSLWREATYRNWNWAFASRKQRSNLNKAIRQEIRKQSRNENTFSLYILCRLKCLCPTDTQTCGSRLLQLSPPRSGEYFAGQQGLGRTALTSLLQWEEHKIQLHWTCKHQSHWCCVVCYWTSHLSTQQVILILNILNNPVS